MSPKLGQPRWLWGTGLAVILVGGVSWGGWQVRERLRADMQRDLIWYAYLGGAQSLTAAEVDRFQGSRRWFPLNQPVLHAWSESGDPVRQNYARMVWESQGKPYTTQWLTARLTHNSRSQDLPTGFSTYEATDPKALILYGLDDPATLTRLITLALKNLDPQRDSWTQFNAAFVQAMGQTDASLDLWKTILTQAETAPPPRAQLLISLFPYDMKGIPPEIANSVAALKAKLSSTKTTAADGEQDWEKTDQIWQQLTALGSPTTPATAEQIKALYTQVAVGQQGYFLQQAGGNETLSPTERLLLQMVARDDRDPQQVLAGILLWLKKDTSARQLLVTVTDREFERLYPIKEASNSELLLLQLAEAFPESRFTKACREYAAIRGGSYFGDWRTFDSSASEETGDLTLRRPFPPAQESQRWQAWLKTYPTHPGADDATYWLARSQEWQGQRLSALQTLADWVVTPNGDRDMQWQIRSRLFTLLDVGTTVDDLKGFLQQHPQHPLRFLMQYTLALHQARQHQYTQALATSADLTLDNLESKDSVLALPEWFDPQPLAPQWADQKQRWQRLSQIRDPYQLAIAWAQVDGWRNSYFLPFNGSRGSSLAFDPISRADLEEGSPIRPDQPILKAGYQQANHHAIALGLLSPLASGDDRAIQEKALYWQGVVLYRQFVSYPVAETLAMIPLQSLSAAVGEDRGLYDPPKTGEEDPYGQYWAALQEKNAWYVRQIVGIINQLHENFPGNPYGDDLLLSVYGMTGESRWLEQLLEDYPQGDRATEAEAALYMSQRPVNN